MCDLGSGIEALSALPWRLCRRLVDVWRGRCRISCAGELEESRGLLIGIGLVVPLEIWAVVSTFGEVIFEKGE